MNYFTTVLFLALGVSASPDNPTWQDLRNALNTQYRIWVTHRSFERYTNNEKHTCVYALRSSLNGVEYEFDQYFDHGTKREKEHLYGEISQDTHHTRPVLTVSREQGRPGLPYTLQYWDESHHCGVLTFRENGEFRCELHVWESDLGQTQSCLREYQRFCSHSYPVYYTDCLTRTF